MPLYVFRCRECGRIRERLFSANASESQIEYWCEEDGTKTERMLSSPNFKLEPGIGGFQNKINPRS